MKRNFIFALLILLTALACVGNGAGMKDKAAAEYEHFLKKKPDYPEKKKLQQYIAENKRAVSREE